MEPYPENRMSLYTIKTELIDLLDAMQDGFMDDAEAQAAIAEHAQQLRELFDQKADDYAALIRVCQTRAAARREEAERMAMLAKEDERKAERLTAMLLQAMSETGRKSVQTERFKISIKRNGGKVPVVITDEAALPIDFRVPKVTETIDKDGIREALEAGKEVPGAVLGERGQRLELK